MLDETQRRTSSLEGARGRRCGIPKNYYLQYRFLSDDSREEKNKKSPKLKPRLKNGLTTSEPGEYNNKVKIVFLIRARIIFELEHERRPLTDSTLTKLAGN